MSHLTLETLARLVDEAPAPEERTHLDGCAHCTAELETLRADAAALAALPEIDPPDTHWPAIRGRLEREGLVRRSGRIRWTTALVRMAAALALFLLGGIAGAAWRSEPGPSAVTRLDDNRAAVPVEDRDTPPAPEPNRLVQDVMEPGTIRPIERARSMGPDPLPEGGSAADVARYLREAESRYFEMLTRYAELAGGTEPGDPLARLAALESIVLTTRAALGEAPADPIINGYHLTALAQREATIRQIAATGDSWF